MDADFNTVTQESSWTKPAVEAITPDNFAAQFSSAAQPEPAAQAITPDNFASQFGSAAVGNDDW